MKTKVDKVGDKIRSCIEGYRRATANLKTVEAPSERWTQACHMMQDRYAGAIDALYDLHPEHEAWEETKWTH